MATRVRKFQRIRKPPKEKDLEALGERLDRVQDQIGAVLDPLSEAVGGLGTGAAANLSDNTPQPLGTAAAGTSSEASRSDHVHQMPTAADVGAEGVFTQQSVSTATALSGTGNLNIKITATFDGAITLPAATTAGQTIIITDTAGVGSGSSNGSSSNLIYLLVNSTGSETITTPFLSTGRTRLLLWQKYGSVTLVSDGTSAWNATDCSGWHIDPRAVSGLEAWYDARRGVTLNSTTVSAWADLSGAGINLSQGVAANQPTYIYASNLPVLIPIRNAAALSFDGTNDILTSTNTVAITSGSLNFFGVIGQSWSTNSDGSTFSSTQTATLGFAWFIRRATTPGASGLPVGDMYMCGGGTGFNNPQWGSVTLLNRAFLPQTHFAKLGASPQSILQNRARQTASTVGNLAVPNFTQTLNAGSAAWSGYIFTLMLFDADLSQNDYTDIQTALLDTFPPDL